jgi:hypothetical protein
LKIGKVLSIGTGTVQRVLMEQPPLSGQSRARETTAISRMIAKGAAFS